MVLLMGRISAFRWTFSRAFPSLSASSRSLREATTKQRVPFIVNFHGRVPVIPLTFEAFESRVEGEALIITLQRVMVVFFLPSWKAIPRRERVFFTCLGLLPGKRTTNISPFFSLFFCSKVFGFFAPLNAVWPLNGAFILVDASFFIASVGEAFWSEVDEAGSEVGSDWGCVICASIFFLSREFHFSYGSCRRWI